jgi:hypothetical protein
VIIEKRNYDFFYMATKKEIGVNTVMRNTKKYAFKRFSKTGIPLKYKVK